MELVTKPDFGEARVRWRAFWQHEMSDRPCAVITSPKDGAIAVSPPEELGEAKGDPAAAAEGYCAVAERRFWGGKAVPFQYPDFGPDVFGAFLGARLQHSPHSTGTSWSIPLVESWLRAFPLRLDPANPTWRRMLDTVETFARVCEGRMLVGMLDLHSNLDVIKEYHRELRPELSCYVTRAPSEGEARAFLKWLEDHT